MKFFTTRDNFKSIIEGDFYYVDKTNKFLGGYIYVSKSRN